MKIGKLPNEVLDEIVINSIKNKKEEVLVGSNIGEDTAIIDFGEELCVLSTDPITGASKGLGKLAINISCNDVVTTGATPIAVLITILAPQSTTKEDIKEIMMEASEVSKELDIEIAGGHTEITDAVNRIVISTTVIGKQIKSKLPRKSEIKIGDKILVSKSVGIEGTSIIAKEKEEYLKEFLSFEEIELAKKLDSKLSVVNEGLIAGDIGVHYMHDVTEGGVLGALWEMSIAIGKGINIDIDKIPVLDITKKIGSLFDIDIYKLISSGSMLMIADVEKSKDIIQKCSQIGIQITEIGQIIEGQNKQIQMKSKLKQIESPGSDELYKVLEF